MSCVSDIGHVIAVSDVTIPLEIHQKPAIYTEPGYLYRTLLFRPLITPDKSHTIAGEGTVNSDDSGPLVV